MINPKIAPKLPPDQMKVDVAPWLTHLSQNYSRRMLPALLRALAAPGKAMAFAGDRRVTRGMLAAALARALVPAILGIGTLALVWWYVVIHSQQVDEPVMAETAQVQKKEAAGASPAAAPADAGGVQEPPSSGGVQEPPGSGGLQEPPGSAPADQGGVATPPGADEPLRQMGDPSDSKALAIEPVPGAFYIGFWIACAAMLALLAWYYARFDAEQFEILGMLIKSVMPLGLLTVVVLAVILFGITTATESAAVGAAGAFLMAWQARTLNFERIKEAVFLTAKTTAMVCWLFVGSALFSAVFALLGGQHVVEQWVLGMNLSPLQFLLISQAIIFVLGWPLEWTEIIVIFVPIFLPLLQHFQIDPILWGVLVFVNLQAAFLSPPVAMSAFYLKGVSPPHVTINQIFAGMMPYMLIVILCMVFMYIWPGMTLWLPKYLYG
jgi:TRAP-type mannitol/chloroaromatic compound transport system permease large subunit